MATYDFQCRECGVIQQDVVIPMSKYDTERPECCGEIMPQLITHAPMVHWTHPPMEATPMPAIPGNPVITSHRQRDELMARHDLVDANDIGPVTSSEEQKVRDEIDASIREISAPEGVDLTALDIT